MANFFVISVIGYGRSTQVVAVSADEEAPTTIVVTYDMEREFVKDKIGDRWTVNIQT